LATFDTVFRETYLDLARAKFGWRTIRPGDPLLVAEFLELLAAEGADYTNSFRALSGLSGQAGGADPLESTFTDQRRWGDWRTRYRARLAAEGSLDIERQPLMRAANPKFVLRNYLAQQAIAAAENRDYDELARLHAVLRAPYDEQPGNEAYAAAPPAGAEEIAVSCSS
jgi:uncharacterized protein YdiU (UPF0061 family)